MTPDLFHYAVHLGHRQILSTHQTHQKHVRFGQRAAFVEQRMCEQLLHNFARTPRPGGLDEGK